MKEKNIVFDAAPAGVFHVYEDVHIKLNIQCYAEHSSENNSLACLMFTETCLPQLSAIWLRAHSVPSVCAAVHRFLWGD